MLQAANSLRSPSSFAIRCAGGGRPWPHSAVPRMAADEAGSEVRKRAAAQPRKDGRRFRSRRRGLRRGNASGIVVRFFRQVDSSGYSRCAYLSLKHKLFHRFTTTRIWKTLPRVKFLRNTTSCSLTFRTTEVLPSAEFSTICHYPGASSKGDTIRRLNFSIPELLSWVNYPWLTKHRGHASTENCTTHLKRQKRNHHRK